MTPSPKWPKCHLNDQNRHFVNSEPPGPAFFEFQGVPRDPVLRPKSTPSFLYVKNDHVFMFCAFSISPFCTFYDFCISVKVTFLRGVSFFDHLYCNVIRPYCNGTLILGSCWGDSQERRYVICVVVLPSFFWGIVFLLLFIHVGEITQVGVLNYSTLVLPSLNRILTRVLSDWSLITVGENTQERRDYVLTLVLPSMKPKPHFVNFLVFWFCAFYGFAFWHLWFVHFDVLTILSIFIYQGLLVWWWYDTVARDPLYVYI